VQHGNLAHHAVGADDLAPSAAGENFELDNVMPKRLIDRASTDKMGLAVI
jgi:hypothetical protein